MTLCVVAPFTGNRVAPVRGNFPLLYDRRDAGSPSAIFWGTLLLSPITNCIHIDWWDLDSVDLIESSQVFD